MFLTGLIKLLIGLAGLTSTFILLFLSAFKRTRSGKLRLAGIVFFSTVGLILIITVIEFQVYPKNPKADQLIMSAYREAPIGGIWLAIYTDQTWEIGNSSREITANGTYEIKSDTLILTAAQGTSIIGEIDQTSFIIQSESLIEINNSGILSLEIILNNMKETAPLDTAESL